MHEMHGLQVALRTRGVDPVPPEGLRVLLFQIARELLFNVVKHAGVHRARVELREEKDRLVLTVQDDGIGFDPWTFEAHPDHARGFGLFNARERLELVGGRLEVESAPGRGTRATVTVPLR
jgi:signal transduction histidine kinase